MIDRGAGCIYRAGSILCNAGPSVVLEGLDRFEQPVVMKIFRPEEGRFGTAEQQWQRELTVLQRLQHPRVIALLDAFICGNLHYLVLERGEANLAELLGREGPLDPVATCELARQLLAGLEEMHRRGLLHNDISSLNLLVDGLDLPAARRRYRYCDFGLSCELSSPWRSSRPTGVLALVPPEFLGVGETSPTVASDLYSLGLLLLEAHSGGLPMDGDRNDAELSELILAGTASRCARDLSSPLAPVIARLLAVDPSERFDSALQAWQVLRDQAAGAAKPGLPGNRLAR
ncbi:MAG: protein kinase [Synechococcaceae cyanobacterium]|nr:protein kinase [Synechococcaceae cyanobacterium]